MDIEKTLRISQLVANLAQILLVIGVYVAWRQAKIAIQDIKIRSQREAGIFAVAQAERFAKEIIDDFQPILSKLKSHGTQSLSLKQFRPDEIFTNLKSRYLHDTQLFNDVDFGKRALSLTNKIESIALSFTKGFADQEVVFQSIGGSYCEIVELLYFSYCLNRKDKKSDLYQSTIDLYNIWKQRMKKLNLEKDVLELEVKTLTKKKEIEVVSVNSNSISPVVGKDFDV